MTQLAIVTGGTRGIGASIATALKKKGFEVVANYHQNDKNADLFSQSNSIRTMKWDVSNVNECIESVKKIEAEYNSTIEVLVNNAGTTKDLFFHKMQPSDWQSIINTNLFSCFNMCHAVINQMRLKNFGRIVNISSVNGQTGQIGQTNYGASKAGIIGFTKALAKESISKNITVNCIAPGYTDTDLVQKIPHEVTQKIISEIPIKRLGTPEEIAHAVLFLIDNKSGFITGSTLSINGGYYMT